MALYAKQRDSMPTDENANKRPCRQEVQWILGLLVGSPPRLLRNTTHPQFGKPAAQTIPAGLHIILKETNHTARNPKHRLDNDDDSCCCCCFWRCRSWCSSSPMPRGVFLLLLLVVVVAVVVVVVIFVAYSAVVVVG